MRWQLTRITLAFASVNYCPTHINNKLLYHTLIFSYFFVSFFLCFVLLFFPFLFQTWKNFLLFLFHRSSQNSIHFILFVIFIFHLSYTTMSSYQFSAILVSFHSFSVCIILITINGFHEKSFQIHSTIENNNNKTVNFCHPVIHHLFILMNALTKHWVWNILHWQISK